MSENDMAEFQREGEITYSDEETTEEDTSADSPSEDDNQGGDTQSTDGDNSQSHDTTPFDQHPRWKERETDWTSRFNEQETRHQKDLEDIRTEFAGRREANATDTQIPEWFGGSQAQWDSYRKDQDTRLQASEQRVIEAIEKKRTTESDAVAEATTFMRTEISAIESDKDLNPTGEKIDANALFKVVFDNQLLDAKGRWNYRAGMRIMRNTPAAAPAPRPQQQARKEAGAATASDARGGEPKPKDFTTSEDFKTDRPW